MPTNATTRINLIKACLLVLAGGFAAQHNRLPLDSDHFKVLFVAVLLIFAVRRVRWVAFVLLGFTLFVQAGSNIVDARLNSQFSGDSMLASVRITDFPRVSGASVSMLIEAIGDSRIPARSRVVWYEPSQLPAIGDIWQFELRLRRPRGNSNPGVFSLENWMFREKLHAAGYVVPGKRNRLISSASFSWVESYRYQFVERAKEVDGNSAAVLAAVGVGARHLISPQQWDRYAKTGSSHLMAISGLHIGLAAAFSFAVIAFVSGVLRLPGNHLDRASIASAAVAAAYALISGFAVPSQRATIMLGLAAFAFLIRRRANPGRIVAQVALLVFVSDPVSLMAPGFSLSFGAVVLLLWCARIYWRPVTGIRFLQVAHMQLVLLFGLMPLTVLMFQRIAFTAPLVNLITVPVFSLITVPLALVSMAIHPLWAAASDLLLRLSAISVARLEQIIGVFAELSIADVFVAGVGGSGNVVLCFVILPLLWVVLPRGWPGRWIAVLGAIALLSHRPASPPLACFDTHVLDVGQGLAVVVKSMRRTLVFDTGKSFRGGGSAAEQVVLPFLRHQRISSIDWLVVSHSDDDHAGGVAALAGLVEDGRIYVGEELSGADLNSFECRAGQFWRADGLEFRFLHPGPDTVLSGNDSSCVLAISAGQHRLLLTGDIESAAELEVLARLPFAAASVVLIPHHGSLTSSSPSFVNHLRPNLAVVSTGYANRWGFPRNRVIRRWEGAGAVILDTASSGAISFRLCSSDGISLLREDRLRRQRFWHERRMH